MRKFITVLVVLVLSVPTFGVITAYNSYDSGITAWDSTLDPDLTYTSQGTQTHLPGGNGSYPAGNPAFGGCLDNGAEGRVLHIAGGAMGFEDTYNYAEGTIEAWVAPH